jgi:hypothetical protein
MTISSWTYVCVKGGSDERFGPSDRAREERREAVRPFSATAGARLVLGPMLGARLPAREAGRDEGAASLGCTDGAREVRRDGALRGEVIGSWDGARRFRGDDSGSKDGARRLRGEDGPREGARDVARPVVWIGGRSVSRSSVSVSSPMEANDASGSSDRSTDTAAGYLISTLGAMFAASTSEQMVSLLSSTWKEMEHYQLRLLGKPLRAQQRLVRLEPLHQPWLLQWPAPPQQ